MARVGDTPHLCAIACRLPACGMPLPAMAGFVIAPCKLAHAPCPVLTGSHLVQFCLFRRILSLSLSHSVMTNLCNVSILSHSLLSLCFQISDGIHSIEQNCNTHFGGGGSVVHGPGEEGRRRPGEQETDVFRSLGIVEHLIDMAWFGRGLVRQVVVALQCTCRRVWFQEVGHCFWVLKFRPHLLC